MAAAIHAWTGAIIHPIEPEPGVDGRAFIAYQDGSQSPALPL